MVMWACCGLDAYANRGKLEQDYICLDILRTLPFAGWITRRLNLSGRIRTDLLWCAAKEQLRVYKLLDLMWPPPMQEKGWLPLMLMRLIWDGRTKNWHLGNRSKLRLSKWV